MVERHVVGPLSDLPPGSRRIVNIGRRSIGVFNIDGTFYGLSNICPHAGGPLCLGDVTGTTEAKARHYDVDWIRDGEIIRCPWHAWEVDIRTGRTLAGPELTVKTYKVVVEHGQILVEA